MTAQWEVGALVDYESNHGFAVLLVVESEPFSLERVVVLWGNGEFTPDVGRSFIWDFSCGTCRRLS